MNLFDNVQKLSFFNMFFLFDRILNTPLPETVWCYFFSVLVSFTLLPSSSLCYSRSVLVQNGSSTL